MRILIVYEVFCPEKDEWVTEKTVATTLQQFTEAMTCKEREFAVIDAWSINDSTAEAAYWAPDYKPVPN